MKIESRLKASTALPKCVLADETPSVLDEEVVVEDELEDELVVELEVELALKLDSVELEGM